jgi:O-antigen biosynthesis protein
LQLIPLFRRLERVRIAELRLFPKRNCSICRAFVRHCPFLSSLQRVSAPIVSDAETQVVDAGSVGTTKFLPVLLLRCNRRRAVRFRCLVVAIVPPLRVDRQNGSVVGDRLTMYWQAVAHKQKRDDVEGKLPKSTAARSTQLTLYWQRLFLRLRVHVDALFCNPLHYAQAIAWRVGGLRVRSRNRIAPLMGRSPRAYRLWIASVEPRIRAELLCHRPEKLPRIVPVIDCTEGSDGVEATVASLNSAEGGADVIVIGHHGTLGTVPISSLSDLSKLLKPEGTWLCIVGAGDQLAPGALEIYARAAARERKHSVIYADDDLLEMGYRCAPHFKSDWNPELFDNHDFLTKSAIVRATPEMIRDLSAPGWVEALTRAAVRDSTPRHLSAVLHHRRTRPQPAIPGKPRPLFTQSMPLVSVIVPTRNGRLLLQTCVDGIRRTAYPNVDLIIVDNGSDDPETLGYLDVLAADGARVLRIEGPFNFSALNNSAAEHARGEFLCFLNNDVELADPDWLALLVRQAVRPEIGAVGARLLYPDGTIQHAGVVTGVGGGAAHAHRFEAKPEDGYFCRSRLPQRVSAVTAACLVVAKNKFAAVGGFNDRDFPVAFNDVDLCLKLNARGWQSFYEPRAVLVHHESKSRGSDSAIENRARFADELAALKRHWGTDRLRDPYHHPQLSPFCEQFHIAV